MQRLGQIIDQKRNERGLSIQQLARMAGVSSSYLYAIEADLRGSKFVHIAKIAKVLGLSLDELATEILIDGTVVRSCENNLLQG
nr:helix-turn-helix transcriptional regulator [Bacilli bacterium]